MANVVPVPDAWAKKTHCNNEKYLKMYERSTRDPEGFWVLGLPALLRMKLTSMRDVDRVHVADLLRVGIIDQSVRNALPADLRQRLEEIEQSIEDDL